MRKFSSKRLPEPSTKTPNAIEELATQLFAGVVHSKVEHRLIFMLFYKNLMKMLHRDPELNYHIRKRDIYVVFKGTNSLIYHNVDAPPSDFDYTIYIKPDLHNFDALHKKVTRVVTNVMAFFKKHLDTIFGFYGDVKENEFLQQVVDAFSAIDGATHPFELVLNKKNDLLKSVSRNSVVLVRDSDGNIVRQEVQQFAEGQSILKRSPIVCSANTTISFFRDLAQTHVGHFDLFRMRMLFKYENTNKMMNMIDVSVFHKSDNELRAFWDTKDLVFVKDATSTLAIFSSAMVLAEIDRILANYECTPELKDKLLTRKQFFQPQ